ncbi:MAG: hypothetical protein Q7K48_04135 [Fusobacterium sp. JB021]|nr:hypothetical protein [Fusobacterium sp. JB021]
MINIEDIKMLSEKFRKSFKITNYDVKRAIFPTWEIEFYAKRLGVSTKEINKVIHYIKN